MINNLSRVLNASLILESQSNDELLTEYARAGDIGGIRSVVASVGGDVSGLDTEKAIWVSLTSSKPTAFSYLLDLSLDSRGNSGYRLEYLRDLVNSVIDLARIPGTNLHHKDELLGIALNALKKHTSRKPFSYTMRGAVVLYSMYPGSKEVINMLQMLLDTGMTLEELRGHPYDANNLLVAEKDGKITLTDDQRYFLSLVGTVN